MNLALLVFGADMVSVQATGMREGFSVGPVQLIYANIVIFLAAVTLVIGLNLFLTRTYMGRAIRATSQNRFAAPLMGINVNKVYILTFGIGSGCVGLAAALVAPTYPVFPTIGTYFVLTAFVIVGPGGHGESLRGVCRSMIIGLVDSLSGYYIAPDLKEVVYFLIFIVILIARPTGLLGLAGERSEVAGWTSSAPSSRYGSTQLQVGLSKREFEEMNQGNIVGDASLPIPAPTCSGLLRSPGYT